jgi:hypothetical protein
LFYSVLQFTKNKSHRNTQVAVVSYHGAHFPNLLCHTLYAMGVLLTEFSATYAPRFCHSRVNPRTRQKEEMYHQPFHSAKIRKRAQKSKNTTIFFINTFSSINTFSPLQKKVRFLAIKSCKN